DLILGVGVAIGAIDHLSDLLRILRFDPADPVFQRLIGRSLLYILQAWLTQRRFLQQTVDGPALFIQRPYQPELLASPSFVDEDEPVAQPFHEPESRAGEVPFPGGCPGIIAVAFGIERLPHFAQDYLHIEG